MRDKISRAVSWSAVDLLIRNGLSLLILVVLARILSPADFGLVAMLALFVAVGNLLIDSGFGQAIIQRQKSSLTDESTIFYFTLIMGAVIALILCLVAPLIALFYGQPVLEEMAYLMALNLFLNAFGTMHTTLLTKELNFKTISIAGASATLVSGGVAIIMALQGWGVWSLVGQVLASTIMMVTMLWLLHPWRPVWVFSFLSLRSYFSFGGFVLWTGILSTIHTNLYALIVGKLHSIQDVGYYSQARRLQLLPVNIMTTIVSRVAFPVFSAFSDDKARLARGMRKALTSVMFINIPLMLSILMLSEDLVLVLFGEKWLPSAPVLYVLAVAGLVFPFNALNIDVLKAQGHSALNARIQLIRLTIGISLLIMTSPFGIVAIAYGHVIASLLALLVNTHYTKKFLNYGALAQLRDIVPYVAASAPMILVILLVMQYAGLSSHSELFVAALAGGLTYLMMCKVAGLEAIEDLAAMINSRKK